MCCMCSFFIVVITLQVCAHLRNDQMVPFKDAWFVVNQLNLKSLFETNKTKGDAELLPSSYPDHEAPWQDFFVSCQLYSEPSPSPSLCNNWKRKHTHARTQHAGSSECFTRRYSGSQPL